MARHPEYQEKCRDEIIDICGVKGDIKWLVCIIDSLIIKAGC